MVDVARISIDVDSELMEEIKPPLVGMRKSGDMIRCRFTTSTLQAWIFFSFLLLYALFWHVNIFV